MKKVKSIISCVAIISIAACTKENVITNQQPDQLLQAIPIPNGDFESWPYLRPQYWDNNSCPFCTPPYETYIVQQDSNPWQGSFAAKFIYNNAYTAFAENKFSVPSHPNNLTAYVKCDLYGTDTVFVGIKLLYNSAVVDSGQWLGTSSIANYTQINIPVTQNAVQVDSAVILIQGGHKTGFPFNNTEFWIDDLQLQ